jgi:hypothetical protein
MKSAETRGKAEQISFTSASARLLLASSSTLKMDLSEMLSVKTQKTTLLKLGVWQGPRHLNEAW